MKKKYLKFSLILILILSIISIFTYLFKSKYEKYNFHLEAGINAMNNGLYGLALTEFKDAKNIYSKSSKLNLLQNIILNYENAKKNYSKKDYSKTKEYLSKIPNEYINYPIKVDINTLKNNLNNITDSKLKNTINYSYPTNLDEDSLVHIRIPQLNIQFDLPSSLRNNYRIAYYKDGITIYYNKVDNKKDEGILLMISKGTNNFIDGKTINIDNTNFTIGQTTDIGMDPKNSNFSNFKSLKDDLINSSIVEKTITNIN